MASMDLPAYPAFEGHLTSAQSAVRVSVLTLRRRLCCSSASSAPGPRPALSNLFFVNTQYHNNRMLKPWLEHPECCIMLHYT